jgi:hypothetical protein
MDALDHWVNPPTGMPLLGVKYHQERWGLTHVDIFVQDNEFHVAKPSFDAVGLDMAVALNFSLYSAHTTSGGRDEEASWLAKECHANANLGKRDYLIEFELDQFLVSNDSSFTSLRDIFDSTDNPDAVVFQTYTNHYGICINSNASMQFASAAYVSCHYPDFTHAPCPDNHCSMSDGVIIDRNQQQDKCTNGPHLIRFTHAGFGLHEDVSTENCVEVNKDCRHICHDGQCTDIDDTGRVEDQVTSINLILSGLDLIPNKGKDFRHQVECYAQWYPDLFAGYCHKDVSKCPHDRLHDHYIQHGAAAHLVWECDDNAAS